MPPTDTLEPTRDRGERPQAERALHVVEPGPQMPFSEIPERAYAEGEGPYDGQDDGIVSYDVPEPFISDPSYIAVIYIDPRKPWPKAELERIHNAYTQRFPGRTFTYVDLHPDALRVWRPFQFPEAEQLFLQQGYACEVDGRGFRPGQGGSRSRTLFDQQQRDALYASAALLWEMLERAGPELGVVDPWEGRAMAAYRPILDQQVARQMGFILGSAGRNSDPLHLVEYCGLLLGRETLTKDHRIHLAAASAPDTARKEGRRPEVCRALFGQAFGPVCDQIRFELAGATQLFAARHWPRYRAGDDVTATAGMVATWYSQVVAVLRKLVWEAEARSAPKVLKDALRREAKAHPEKVGFDVVPTPREVATYEQHRDDQIDTLAEELKLFATQFTTEFTGEQWASAALHGGTLNDDIPEHRPDPFRLSAAWIGSLKRTGQAWLDPDDAEALLGVAQQARGESERFFRSQFSEEVWDVWYDAVAEVCDTGNDLLVTYTWTRDLDRPWSAQRTEEGLILTGPLLSFPACDAASWREKAACVRDLNEFTPQFA